MGIEPEGLSAVSAAAPSFPRHQPSTEERELAVCFGGTRFQAGMGENKH